MRARVALLAAVVAIAGGASAVAARWPAAVGEPAASGASGGRMVLTATGVGALPICPGPQTLVAPPGGDTQPPGGPVAVGALTQGGAAALGDHALVGAGGLGTLTLPRTTAGAVALQPGAAAPLVSMVQLGLARVGDTRGLAALACSTPSTQTWLVGGGTQPGRRGRLLLANPAATPATVDVVVHGAGGVVVTTGGGGVVVPAKAQVALLVDALAPDQTAVAVDVRARTGRVAASLHDTWVRGVTPAGTDDVTAAAPAARTQWVPGVSVAPPAGVPLPGQADDPGAVAVRVVNPGAEVAVARVRLVGDSGSVPLDHAVVSVPPGGVVDVPVTGVPAGVYTAQVDADAPVVAGAVVGRLTAGGEAAGTSGATGRDVPPSEFGWATSVDPLTAPALVALPALTDGGHRVPVTATLALTATSAATAVEVTELDDRAGVLWTGTVALPAGTSATQLLSAQTAGVRVRPVGGAATPVAAALVLQAPDPSGPLVAVLPVRPGAAGGGSNPQVVADVRVGLRG